jgi:hypothetical protein
MVEPKEGEQRRCAMVGCTMAVPVEEEDEEEDDPEVMEMLRDGVGWPMDVPEEWMKRPVLEGEVMLTAVERLAVVPGSSVAGA